MTDIIYSGIIQPVLVKGITIMSVKKSNDSRRKLLKSIAAGSGAVVAAKTLPESWTKPVVNTVLLPTHAQATNTEEDEGSSCPQTMKRIDYAVDPCDDTGRVRIFYRITAVQGDDGCWVPEITSLGSDHPGLSDDYVTVEFRNDEGTTRDVHILTSLSSGKIAATQAINDSNPDACVGIGSPTYPNSLPIDLQISSGKTIRLSANIDFPILSVTDIHVL